MTNTECAACHRTIDAAARLCPYCGADPATGERVIETQEILQEVFHPREATRSDSVLQYARERQGIVVVLAVVVLFLVLVGIHRFVTARNASAVTDAPAVPLTEIADVTTTDAVEPVEMPDLEFQYDGQPQKMRTYIVEAGAVTPPEVVAEQQAAAAAQQPATTQPGAARRPAPQQPRPQTPPARRQQ